MGNYNPADYETVDSRIKRFYADHPHGRLVSDLVAYEGAIGATRWIVRTSVYRDRESTQPDGTGYAFEVDGQGGMANRTAALENAETSSAGRALANIGYSGDRRASREEMRKASEPDTRTLDVLVDEWVLALTDAGSLTELQDVWDRAGKAGVTADPRVVAVKDRQKAALK